MSNPGATATRGEKKKDEEKRACKDQFSERGVIQDKQASRRRTKKKIIGSILHQRPVVKGGIRKKKNFVDIKQCEARSSNSA